MGRTWYILKGNASAKDKYTYSDDGASKLNNSQPWVNNNLNSHGKKATTNPWTKCNIRRLAQIAFKSRPPWNTPGYKKKHNKETNINEVSKQPHAWLHVPTSVASTSERYEVQRVRPKLKLQRKFWFLQMAFPVNSSRHGFRMMLPNLTWNYSELTCYQLLRRFMY